MDELGSGSQSRLAAPRPGDGHPATVSIPFGPGRAGISRRSRGLMAVALLGLVAITAVFGVLMATGVLSAPGRVVTIPAADRTASPALLRAAEAIGFQPRTVGGAGVVEDDPLIGRVPPSSSHLLPVGSTAPQFSLLTPTGARVTLHSLRGRTVLLEFFATWCPHCAAEAPHLKQILASLPRKPYSFVSVDADGETAPSVLAFHIYFGLGYPALLDPSSHPGSFARAGSAGPVSSAYKARVYPTFYVLDPAGRIVWAAQGEQPDAVLRHVLLQARAG